jgi:hypothetical protein
VGEFGDFQVRATGIHAASNGVARVLVLRTQKDRSTAAVPANSQAATFYFILNREFDVNIADKSNHHLVTGDAITLPADTPHKLNALTNSEILCVIF